MVIELILASTYTLASSLVRYDTVLKLQSGTRISPGQSKYGTVREGREERRLALDVNNIIYLYVIYLLYVWCPPTLSIVNRRKIIDTISARELKNNKETGEQDYT